MRATLPLLFGFGVVCGAGGCATGVQDELAPLPAAPAADGVGGGASDCLERGCAPGQFCASGLCARQTASACSTGPMSSGDGCPPDAVCLAQLYVDGEPVDVEACYAFPPCSADYRCPVGAYGALCTFGVMENKAPMCVPGLCLAAADCPAATRCIRVDEYDIHGYCSDGGPGASCALGDDCLSGVCDAAANGLVGRCI